MTNPRIEDLRKRLEKEPGSRLFAQLAEELRKDGELVEAIRVARDGLQKHPAYPSARMTLGRALLDKGELAAARSEFESVLKGAPDNILASRFLGECLEGLGDLGGAVARYKSTLLLSPDDRQVMSRLESVQEKLRRGPRQVSGPGQEPRPIPVAQVDEPMVLEVAREGRAVLTGEAPGFDRPRVPLESQPVSFVEESFEVERPYEAPAPPAWQSPGYRPANEVVFEADEADASTIPPTLPPRLFAEPQVPSERTVEVATSFAASAEPVVERGPVAEVEHFVEAEASGVAEGPAEPQPPLASPTLAELYLNQGFTDRAIEVYRQLLEREPGNERTRARLVEIEALDRHLRGEEPRPARDAGLAPAAAPPEPDRRARRREAIERTIARLEGFLVAVRKG